MSCHPDVLNDIPKESLLSQNIQLDFRSETAERAYDCFETHKKTNSLFNIDQKTYPIPNVALPI